MKNKIISHLKGDIKNFAHEAKEDRELIKKLEGKKMKKKVVSKHKKHEAKESKATERKEHKAGKKGDAKLKKEIKAGKKELKVDKVMKEFKDKSLHSSSKNGPLVTKRSQAIAIALNEGKKAISSKKKTKKRK